MFDYTMIKKILNFIFESVIVNISILVSKCEKMMIYLFYH